MIFAILPVKARANAKQRLAAMLTAEQREDLARVMYEDVLDKLTAARTIDRVVVATSDESAAAHARARGVHVFAEPDQHSHSHSADRAATQAKELGAQTVLLLPIDIPLVTTAEIESLAQAAQSGVIIVPDAEGTGTNALVRTPPDAITSRFGKNSFRAHLDQARAKGIPAKVMRPPGIVFDIDTPEDVAELLAREPYCRTARLLRAQRTQWASGF
jgi:2-phospho-L-lactate guanylyltransferase